LKKNKGSVIKSQNPKSRTLQISKNCQNSPFKVKLKDNKTKQYDLKCKFDQKTPETSLLYRFSCQKSKRLKKTLGNYKQQYLVSFGKSSIAASEN
jgi:hypothetical protein